MARPAKKSKTPTFDKLDPKKRNFVMLFLGIEPGYYNNATKSYAKAFDREDDILIKKVTDPETGKTVDAKPYRAVQVAGHKLVSSSIIKQALQEVSIAYATDPARLKASLGELVMQRDNLGVKHRATVDGLKLVGEMDNDTGGTEELGKLIKGILTK